MIVQCGDAEVRRNDFSRLPIITRRRLRRTREMAPQSGAGPGVAEVLWGSRTRPLFLTWVSMRLARIR